MQIRINLDQIFQGSRADDNSAPSDNKSYQYSEVDSYSSYNNRFKVNFPFFEQQHQPQEKASKIPTDQQSKASITSIQTQFSQKLPGQRLYYESLNNVLRKTKQMERLKLQKQVQESKQITFKPKINKNSEKLAVNKLKKEPFDKKESPKIMPTKLIKQREQLIHCTFKPQLIAKPKTITNRPKDQNQIFDQLFNDYKMKQVRQKLKTEGGEREKEKEKKLSKAEFQSFLSRNNQFMSKVEKKKQLILSTSHKFDLQTGHKMFSPKTNNFKSHKNYFANTQSQTKLKPLTFNPKSLFSKNFDSAETNSGSIFGKNRQKQTQKYDNMFKLNSADEQISEINEAKQDEQDEGIKEQANFQTVKGFYFQTTPQEVFKGTEIEPTQKIEIVEQKQQQVQNLKTNNVEQDKDEQKQSQNENEQEHQSNKQIDKVSEGQTHHQGEDSRVLNQDRDEKMIDQPHD